jgi:hypothetical protein
MRSTTRRKMAPTAAAISVTTNSADAGRWKGRIASAVARMRNAIRKAARPVRGSS